MRIEKFTVINNTTGNDRYASQFTAVWKKSQKESISEEFLAGGVREEYYSNGQYLFYFSWAVISGYSMTVIPFYRKEKSKLLLKSKSRNAEKVYDLEYTECFALLLLHCAFFEDFQPALMGLEERIENEIINQAVYDYLKNNEHFPK